MGGGVGEHVGEAPLCRWRELSMLCGLVGNTESLPFPRPHWPLLINKIFGAREAAHWVECLPSTHKALKFLEILNSITSSSS